MVPAFLKLMVSWKVSIKPADKLKRKLVIKLYPEKQDTMRKKKITYFKTGSKLSSSEETTFELRSKEQIS